MAGLNLELVDGGVGAYCARPANGDARVGLVVIQEIFGVNSHIRSVCDRLAESGFLAIAPDMFHRQRPAVELGYGEQDIATGFGLKQQLADEDALCDLQAASSWLRSEGVDKVGVVGFCMGGYYTFLSAARLQPDGAVAYYGGGIGDLLDEADSISCPILFHFGNLDAHIPPEVVDAVEKRTASLDARVFRYDADHGFNCDQRGSYDDSSAQLAWQRTVEFFRNL